MERYLLKTIPFLASFILLSSTGFSQMKLIKKFLSSDADTSRKSSFLPLPILAYSQETGAEIGALSLYSFYTDRQDSLTRTSQITGAATITSEKQTNFLLKADIWSPKNKFHYTGEIRYKNFPFNFYGVGNRTLASDEDPLTQKLFKLNGAIEKQFSESRYSGISVAFESYNFIDKTSGGILSRDPNIFNKEGGKVLFFGFTQIYDSRNSNTYTTKGTFVRLNYSYAPNIFGGDNYVGSLLKMDFSNFQTVSKKTSIGLNANFQSLNGENTPFYLLPQLGSDEMMRAYYTGRYRDENLMALQSEIRFRVHPRIGLVGFAATGNVFKRRDFNLRDFKPNIGGGFRYFFDIEKGLSIRMDYGIGERISGEKRQSGFYLSLGESF
ncbi:polymerase [Daejeonella sp.]|jgi:hypothetical protein|uniref:polymerase n=1 Tax=Daejeonella sp. TaxID=2805397 RepID=UPI00378386B6